MKIHRKKKVDNDVLQASFFDLSQNQYDSHLLIHPKKHVEEEIAIIIAGLGNVKKDIIDFGAGIGRLTIPLINRKYYVKSIDISQTSLHILKKTASRIKRRSYLQVTNTLPTNKKISVIVGADILHHIDMSFFFPLFHKSLNNTGKIIFSEPNAMHIFWFFHIFLKTKWHIEKGIVHCNYIYLMNKLKTYGFKDIYIQGFGLFPAPWFNRYPALARINYYLGNLPFLRFFAFRFIIEAYK